MNKLIPIALVLLLLSACKGTGPEEESLDAKDVFFSYPLEEARTFTVDGEGLVYAVDGTGSAIEVLGLDGQTYNSITPSPDGGIGCLSVGEGALYFTALDRKNPGGEALYRYDLDTGETQELAALSGFEQIKRIAAAGDYVYILAVDPGCKDTEYDLWEGDFRYEYDGTILAAYQLSEDSLEIVYDELVNSFALTPAGNVLIQAHDSMGGFYFTQWNPSESHLGDKIYRDIYGITGFASDGQGILFYSPGGSMMSGSMTLYYASLEEDKGVADIMPNVLTYGYGNIHYEKGYTFYFNALSQRIERIKNAVYIQDNPKIKMVTTTRYSTDIFSGGYNVGIETLPYDEFTLTVLSRDRSYDLCYLSSRQGYAANIRDKGSFYPLNDVPGVKEYMEACFPFIRDAATDPDGNVWMIPINVDVEAIVYHEENCAKAGIDLHNATTLEGLIANLEKAKTVDPGGGQHYLNPYPLQQKSLIKYLRNHETLDTPEFRRLAKTLKSLMEKGDSWGSAMAELDSSGGSTQINPELLYSSTFDRLTQTRELFISRDGLSIIPVTPEDGTPHSAQAVFLCVNPDSDNLQNTLAYISQICGHLLAQTDSCILANPDNYTHSAYAEKLYDLYENSVIDFAISDEIFAHDFTQYLAGQTTLEDMIAEADRKLLLYRNE